VVIRGVNDTLGEWCVRFLNGEFDLLWGPGDSRLAVIRSISEFGERYSAFDLRTSRHLRDENRYDERHGEVGAEVGISKPMMVR